MAPFFQRHTTRDQDIINKTTASPFSFSRFFYFILASNQRMDALLFLSCVFYFKLNSVNLWVETRFVPVELSDSFYLMRTTFSY